MQLSKSQHVYSDIIDPNTGIDDTGVVVLRVLLNVILYNVPKIIQGSSQGNIIPLPYRLHIRLGRLRWNWKIFLIVVWSKVL